MFSHFLAKKVPCSAKFQQEYIDNLNYSLACITKLSTGKAWTAVFTFYSKILKLNLAKAITLYN